MEMKYSGLAIFACSFLLTCTLRAQQTSVLDKVNLYMGTADDHGQMAPGATVPYGQVQVCPDSKPRQHPGYDYEVPTISGFSINRLSGVGGSGCGGNVSLMPDATGLDIRLLKQTEQVSPGYYAVQLSNGVSFAATADNIMAVERFSQGDDLRTFGERRYAFCFRKGLCSRVRTEVSLDRSRLCRMRKYLWSR